MPSAAPIGKATAQETAIAVRLTRMESPMISIRSASAVHKSWKARENACPKSCIFMQTFQLLQNYAFSPFILREMRRNPEES